MMTEVRPDYLEELFKGRDVCQQRGLSLAYEEYDRAINRYINRIK